MRDARRVSIEPGPFPVWPLALRDVSSSRGADPAAAARRGDRTRVLGYTLRFRDNAPSWGSS